jgi:transketolase
MTVREANATLTREGHFELLRSRMPMMVSGASRQAPFADALVALGRSREDVVVLSADLSKYTDLVPFRKAFPDRFIQVGMAEQNMIGIAGGLAKSGLLPIAVTYGVFATRRAFDQVSMALATGVTGPAIVVAFLPGITTPFRATHQATDDLALMREIPGMTVVDPCDATEQDAALIAAAAHDGPVYLRGLRGLVEQRFAPEGFDFLLGRASLVAAGDDGAILATGLGTSWALDAREVLQRSGQSFSVLNVPTLKPIDSESILAVAERHRTIFTIENHSTIGGLASAVSEVVAAEGLGVRVVALGVPDVWAPAGSLDHIRADLGLTADAIAARIYVEGHAS